MLSVICSLVTVLVCWLMCRSYSKRIELSIANTNLCTECLEEHRDALLSHKEHLESIDDWQEEMTVWTDKIVSELVRITNDLDIISSEGQGQVKAITIPKANTAPVNVNIKSDELPLRDHGIVVGKTKSGKTNVLNSLIIRKVQDNQEVRILDVKREMGPIFGNHCIIIDRDNAAQAFIDAVKEADDRQKIFAEASKRYGKRISNLDDYHSVTNDYSLRHITLVVEEWMYLNEDGIDDSQLIKAMVICRSAGIWMLIAVQLLRGDVLSRKASINFGFKVFLGPYDRWAFTTLFDSADDTFKKEAQRFLGKSGKAVVSIEGELETKEMPFIEDAVLEEWMNA